MDGMAILVDDAEDQKKDLQAELQAAKKVQERLKKQMRTLQRKLQKQRKRHQSMLEKSCRIVADDEMWQRELITFFASQKKLK